MKSALKQKKIPLSVTSAFFFFLSSWHTKWSRDPGLKYKTRDGSRVRYAPQDDRGGGCVPLKNGIQIFLFFFLFLSLFSFPSQTHAATLSKPTNSIGLVGWWTFDGKDMSPNVRDISGNARHGNLYGQTSTTTVIGKVGQALSFDGVDDYIVTSTNIPSQSALTVSAWVRPHATMSTNVRIVETKYTDGFALAASADGLLWGFYIKSGATLIASVEVGKWQHIVGVWDGSQLRTYMDGVPGFTYNYSPGQTVANPAYIGKYALGDSKYFDGDIDDVRVYDRALSATEVKGLYNSASAKISATKSPGTLASGLVGHWTFDGKDMTPNVRDVSGSGFHGSLRLGNLAPVTSTTTVSGKIGQAIQFDGINSYMVQVPTAPTVVAPYTTSLWFYPTNIIDNQCLVAHGLSDPGQTLCLVGNFIQVFSGSNFRGTCNYTFTSSDLNRWHHLVFIVNSTTDTALWKCYLNNVDVGVSTVDNTQPYANPGNTDWTLGAYYNNNYAFKGKMDDVRIYNRQISISEVKQLYALGESKTNTSTNVTKGSLDTGLVGLWSFDGKDLTDKVYDRSGQGNNGYIYNSATTTMFAPGKLGQALNFDGVDDYVSVANSGLNLSTAMTMSVWTKSSINDDYSGGVSKANNFNFRLAEAGGPVFYSVTADGSRGFNSGPDLRDGAWHHTACTYDSTLSLARMKCFTDGVLFTTDNVQTGNFVSNSNPVEIGRTFGSEYMPGQIDDVRIYNRALSASEIKQLYNMGR